MRRVDKPEKVDMASYGEQEKLLWGFVSTYNWFVTVTENVANGTDGCGMSA